MTQNYILALLLSVPKPSYIDFIRAAAVIRGRGWRALSRVRRLLE